MFNQGKFRLIATAVLAAILFSVFTIFVFSDASPTVSARGAALFSPDTNTFLYEKNGDTRMPMASTTKIMTALLAAEIGDLSQRIKIPREATGIEGSSLYLCEGEVLSLEELLYGLMLRSANDAATAIALALCGSVSAFAEKMNEKAEALGLSDTHFDNPHGLDSENHFTTAKDLARLGAAAIENETVRRIASTYKITIGEGESRRLIVNHNKLLHSYEGSIGLKTGFTKKCGRCLVGAAERDGVTLVSTTLSAPDDWDDHKRMLDYGFSRLTCYARLAPEQFQKEIAVLGGKESTVTVKNSEGFSLVEEAGLAEVKMQVRLNPTAAAPISKGDVLGQILYLREGRLLGSVSLYAAEDIPALQKKKRGFWPF
ncbi:MAG: D-alanyl-D-alanine carboxypeptidase [Clostridia bacterium]|nr:D-alanyl-D-alanine carboxypeptidase [Clostridia bacterium]